MIIIPFILSVFELRNSLLDESCQSFFTIILFEDIMPHSLSSYRIGILKAKNRLIIENFLSPSYYFSTQFLCLLDISFDFFLKFVVFNNFIHQTELKCLLSS